MKSSTLIIYVDNTHVVDPPPYYATQRELNVMPLVEIL